MGFFLLYLEIYDRECMVSYGVEWIDSLLSIIKENHNIIDLVKVFYTFFRCYGRGHEKVGVANHKCFFYQWATYFKFNIPPQPNEDCSHLCHEKNCLLHTIYEDKDKNNQRNICEAVKCYYFGKFFNF